MNNEEFYRIKRLPPYVFAQVTGMKQAARAAGADIIDLGMGNPDQPTPTHIVEKLVETVRDPKTAAGSRAMSFPACAARRRPITNVASTWRLTRKPNA